MTVYACMTGVIAWLLSLGKMGDTRQPSALECPGYAITLRKQWCKVLCRTALLLRTCAQAVAAQPCSVTCPSVQQSSRCHSQVGGVG